MKMLVLQHDQCFKDGDWVLPLRWDIVFENLSFNESVKDLFVGVLSTTLPKNGNVS